jgi:hypothetical protein
MLMLLVHIDACVGTGVVCVDARMGGGFNTRFRAMVGIGTGVEQGAEQVEGQG